MAAQVSSSSADQPEWDMVIEPQAPWFRLNLKDIWRYRDLLILFVRRDFVAAFKQTILGPIWHFVQPILTTIVFLVVFNRIAGISTGPIEPIVFYMSGITIWNYFNTCLTGTASTFVANANIFGKVYFPRLILPLSVVISNIVRFGIQFLLLLLVMIYFGITKGHFYFGWSWLMIPVLLLMMAMFGLGLGIIISALTTKYRDFNVLIGFGVQLLMYITPVVYPLSFFENSRYRALIEWNPLSPMVEGFRWAVLGSGTVSVGSLLYSAGIIGVLLFVGMVLFNRVERSFMDTV